MTPARTARPQLVTIGETLASISNPAATPLRHARHLDLGIGGAESNVAIGAARLGTSTAWVGRVGNDELGRLITRELSAEGVDVRCTIDDVHPTALMLKSHRTSTLMNVSYYRRSSAGSRLCKDDIDPTLITNAAVLHVSAITPALSPGAREAVHFAISTAKEAGVIVSIDLNYRAALWSTEEAAGEFQYLASVSDVLFATVEEAGIAVEASNPEKAAERLSELGAGHVLIKQGAQGALSLQAQTFTAAPAFPVDAIDNIGAGDAFAAGYLAAMIRGGSLNENLSWASALGAWAVSTAGDWEGLPTLDELKAFLNAAPHGETVSR